MLLGRAGPTARAHGQAGRGQDRVGSGWAADACYWVGQCRWPAHAAGRGSAEAGGAEPGGRCVLLGGVRRGWRVQPGGARPRQAEPMTGMHRTAGLGWGRHEVAEGLGRPSVDEGRRGKMGPATGVLCRAGPIQGRAGRGQPSAVGVEPGWPVRGE
jgi:hypothetical protein